MSSSRALAAVVLASALSTSPLAVAQTADTAVNACVVPSTGRVRIVDAAGSCKRRERALTWAVAGPAGAPGQTGATGDPGPAGSSGPLPCRLVGRLGVAGIVGDGAGGSMDVYDYDVATTPSAGGPPFISAISVTKPIDKASPQLLQAALAGTPIPTATLEIFAADGITVATRYELTTVLVAGFAATTAKACTAPVPVDELSLSFVTLVVSGGP
ncbi:MAG: type VI secretion system tube protein Hcp [Candidatus Binatia bacterium]